MFTKKVVVYVVSIIFILTISAPTLNAQSAAEISSQVEVNGWRYVTQVEEEMVDTTEYKKPGPYEIAYITISLKNSFAAQYLKEINEEADRLNNVSLTNLDAQLEVSKQVSAVEDAVAKGYDAIVIDAISPEALQGVLSMARENGVPVIGVSSPVPLDQVTAWVGRNDYNFGKVTGKWLAEKINHEGNIVALSGIAGNTVSEQRWKGAKEIFDQYSEINVLTREFADWSFAKGKTTVTNVLSSYENIDGIWSGGGAMTQGAIEAYENAERELVPMVGEANNGFLLDWIEASEQGFESIAFNNPTNQPVLGLRLAIKALKGEPIPKEVHVTGPYILNLEEAKNYARSDLEDGYWVGDTLSEEAKQELWGK